MWLRCRLLWEDEGIVRPYLDRLEYQDEDIVLNTAEKGMFLKMFVEE